MIECMKYLLLIFLVSCALAPKPIEKRESVRDFDAYLAAKPESVCAELFADMLSTLEADTDLLQFQYNEIRKYTDGEHVKLSESDTNCKIGLRYLINFYDLYLSRDRSRLPQKRLYDLRAFLNDRFQKPMTEYIKD